MSAVNRFICALLAGIVVGLTGCTQSVNEATYVRENEQVLRRIPIYGDAGQIGEYSVGQPAPGGSVWGKENGPPYDAYSTTHAFRVPRASTCARVGDWYRRELPRRGWRWISGYPSDASYVHGHALVSISCSGRSSRATFFLKVDHNER